MQGAGGGHGGQQPGERGGGGLQVGQPFRGGAAFGGGQGGDTGCGRRGGGRGGHGGRGGRGRRGAGRRRCRQPRGQCGPVLLDVGPKLAQRRRPVGAGAAITAS
ncbi:hypothetical protein ACFQ1I_16860 [Kitasatospora arboriphila]